MPRHHDRNGPTAGDRVRLADTDLQCEVERDLSQPTRPGEALPGATAALDLVIVGAIVMDPLLGVVRADIGVRDGLIVGVGRAGDPERVEGVTPGLGIGPATGVVTARGLIATPGGVDTHIHMISPQQAWTALASGITTMLGGGTGPTEATCNTTCTPGPWNIAQMLRAGDSLPVNWGVFGKGN